MSSAPLTIPQIAEKLTKAQRAYLIYRAVQRSATGCSEPRWMTFPPTNTFRVLRTLGLVDGCGQIRDKGLSARQYLLDQDTTQ